MANDWILMRSNLRDDPSVITLAEKLNIHENFVVGLLHSLWSWADQHSRDGHIPGVTKSWIDRHVGRRGFAQALADVGWLVDEGNSLSFPEFERYNGASAKRRADDAVRKRASRLSQRYSGPNVTENRDNGHDPVQQNRATEQNETETEQNRTEKRSNSTEKDLIPDQFSGSGSGDADSDQRHHRSLQFNMWLLQDTHRFWAKGGPQKLADRSSAEKLFKQIIWPEDIPDREGADRLEQVRSEDIPTAARNGAIKMAYLTKLIKSRFSR
jgi:hypothetical protein